MCEEKYAPQFRRVEIQFNFEKTNKVEGLSSLYTIHIYSPDHSDYVWDLCVCTRALLAKSTCKWHTNKTTWILNPNEWQWLLCSTNSSVHPLLVAPANIWTVNTHFSTWLKFELMSFVDKFPYKWSLFQVFIRFLLFKVFEILPHVYVRVHRTWLSNSVT